MASQAMTLLAALPTVFNMRAYVPRWTSVLLVVGLAGVTTALFGLGAPLGALITSLVACAWIFVLIFRGRLHDVLLVQGDLWTEAEAKDEVAEMLEAAAIRVAEAEAEARGESDG